MLARDSVPGFFDLGFVDTAFNAPDPDNHEIVSQEARKKIAPAPSLRMQAYLITKRVCDATTAATLLILFSPLLLIVAVLVRLSSRGPVIFSQNRLTEGGKIFRMYKFRTMHADAEHTSGPVWAEENDPRVTPIGRFLRISHLDELPQLLNVLSGDMSFVGPRPERPELVAKLEAEFPGFRKRLTVKGGITGLAQVSEGYAADMASYQKKLSYDLMYVRKRSLLLDFGIVLKTILVVITGMGAR